MPGFKKNMIAVFHGSTKEIRKPLAAAGRPHLDFGRGFYVTTIREQAVSWACRPFNAGKPKWVSTYDFDYDAVKSGWKVKIFPAYNEDWPDFVIACRKGSPVWEKYDAVEGGIANDRVFNTIELYTAGLLPKAETLSRLSYEKPNNQICIHSQKIIDRYLRFVSSEAF